MFLSQRDDFMAEPMQAAYDKEKSQGHRKNEEEIGKEKYYIIKWKNNETISLYLPWSP